MWILSFSETVERNIVRGSEYVIIEGNKSPGTDDASKEIQKVRIM